MKKIAIVGMEVIFGIDEGLDAFDRVVFDGIQRCAITDPQQKSKAVAKVESKEAYSLLLHGSRPPDIASLMRVVIDGALRNVELEAVQNRLEDMALIVVSPGDLSALQGNFRSFLKEDSVPLALQTAQRLLSSPEVHGVVISAGHLEAPTIAVSPSGLGESPACATFEQSTNCLSVGEGAGAILVKTVERASQDRDCTYAIVDAVVVDQDVLPGSPISSQKVVDVCRNAFDIAGIGSQEVAYLEVQGMEEEDPDEMRGLVWAYRGNQQGLTCALGSARSNMQYTSPVSGIFSLIKVALCLYHRYIPSVPQWHGPKDKELWEKSLFYVVTESRSWFVNDTYPRRIAAISNIETSSVAHLILSKDEELQPRPNRYLSLVSPYCFPLAGDHQTELMSQLEELRQTIEESPNLPRCAEDNLAAFQRKRQASYALMVVGYNKEQLLGEVEFMLKGVPSTFEKGAELKTPKGSYFTANPLGGEGRVAFVYPGVGSAYVGLGQGVFHLCPEIYDRSSELTSDIGGVLKEQELYPRSREPLTREQISEMDLRMSEDVMTIANSGMAFFWIFTTLVRDVFKVTPHCALGYSMGEPGMMSSLGVWLDPLQLTDRFSNSPSFGDRLCGRMDAVREYWRLDSGDPGSHEKVWDCYTLRAPATTVADAIREENRVFITIINSPQEVVIAGDPAGCLRVVKKIGCKSYRLNFDMAIHCDLTRLEYDHLVDLYTLPIGNTTGIKFYSSSCCKAIPIRSKSVAHSIAKAFCQTVDFPRLVNQVYEDGARIFIELGSRKFCCHLIEKILEGREHLAVPINVKGTKDQVSIVRVLAKLVSHRVPVDLSPLF